MYFVSPSKLEIAIRSYSLWTLLVWIYQSSHYAHWIVLSYNKLIKSNFNQFKYAFCLYPVINLEIQHV